LCTADKPHHLRSDQPNRQLAPYHPHYFSSLFSYAEGVLYNAAIQQREEKEKEVREKERGDK